MFFSAVALAGASAPAQAAVIGAGSAHAAASRAATAGGWARARQVPGLATLAGSSGYSGLNTSVML